ncbi:MAG TPA: hypothetical protein PLR26_06750 [Bacilli bacterium]|nr:hypothetical protein [Bacilli bacterium]
MYALFVVLNKTDYLEDILSAFYDLGVAGATIIDSQGMASAIVHGRIQDIPLFGSLKLLLDGERPYNKTIFTVIDNEELVQKVMTKVKHVMKECIKPGVGFMFTVPVGHITTLGE